MSDLVQQRRKKVLSYIARYIGENSYPPSYREIARHCDIRSTSTVSADIHQLIRQGYLSMERGSYRSLSLVESPGLETGWGEEKEEGGREDVYDIPLYGQVAAGQPIYADDYVEEMIPLPASFFPNKQGQYFILTIHGDSMIEAGIFDGDHVIIKKQDTAEDGQQVVALIEDEATVKTLYRHPDYIELRPENAAMEPILTRECRILGIVMGLYRLY